jgi:hypothetical protein
MTHARRFPYGLHVRRGPVRPLGTIVEVRGGEHAVWSDVSTSFEINGRAVVYEGAMLPLVAGDEAVVVGRYGKEGRFHARFVGLPRLQATFGPNPLVPLITGALSTLLGLGLVVLWILMNPAEGGILVLVAIGCWCVIWGLSNVLQGVIDIAGRELLGRALLDNSGGELAVAGGTDR